jgi:hypothetical protein
MSVRIYELARELNLNSQEVVAYCKQAGIDVRPNALERLTYDQRDRLVTFIKRRNSPWTYPIDPAVPAVTATVFSESACHNRAVGFIPTACTTGINLAARSNSWELFRTLARPIGVAARRRGLGSIS